MLGLEEWIRAAPEVLALRTLLSNLVRLPIAERRNMNERWTDEEGIYWHHYSLQCSSVSLGPFTFLYV